MKFETKCLSSLEKVFAEKEIKNSSIRGGSSLTGEVFSFQVAYRSEKRLYDFNIEIESELSENVRIRRVGVVPCEFLGDSIDEYVLRDTPGLFPDPLYEYEDFYNVTSGIWHSAWITVDIPTGHPGGTFEIKVKFSDKGKKNPDTIFEHTDTFKLEVIPVDLPEQKLQHTEWLYADCICSYYNIKAWSQRHWELLEAYFINAAKHGVNMILTPLFTLPLNTQVNAERPTVQLVDIALANGVYSFDFATLDHWIELLFKSGVQYIEFSHLFTQWGAEKTPKIIVDVDGDKQKMFGWHVDACSDEYKDFLDAFLPELVKYIKTKGIADKCVFHVSDEPEMKQLDSYKNAVSMVRDHLDGFTIMDALSDFEFYELGYVTSPVPGCDHIEPFVEAKIKGLWTYYCTAQWDKVPNRFMHMPSARNRVMGLMLYKYKLSGFLHWGYNFWYSQYSQTSIDPYKVTDAAWGYQGGDAFLVYPGENGPIDSIRHEVQYEAIQDLRALKKLESLQGREATIALLEDGLDNELKMTDYPHSTSWLLNLREQINKTIKELTHK